ncbi:tetratricopeptide repeat protein 1 [Curvularia clavata]|uniref:Tetratricopeptide repeat protein 1 n=1 Tax=Curvularia clavata TaxID=95742 RepID=A0A9Q8Z1J3_CURCL|nr:tetratricopeptide repeat protein 1 [Curvularia clavata]
MIRIHPAEHEFDPTITHSFLQSYLIIHTIPWLRSTLRSSILKWHLLSLLQGIFCFSSPPPSPTDTDIPETERHNGIPYVKLNSEYHHCLRKSWTNDPKELYLEYCFDPRLDINLAKDFNVDGLCPVVRAINDDRFILRDANKQYYLWDAWSGKLLRFWETWTEGFASKEELVSGLVCNITWAEMETDVIHC